MKPKELSERFILSSSPHTHADSSIRRIMGDVIIAVMPSILAGIWFFGASALYLALVCVGTCVLTEYLCRRAFGRENTLGDLSAVVTGLILVMNLPAGLPLWMAALGSVFAIFICKQVFGGIGMNAFNPALSARAFMLISFTGPMTTFVKPSSGAIFSCAEAVTTPTPLASMKPMFALAQTSPTPHAGTSGIPSLFDLFVGNMPGCIGEVSAAAIILGAAYLLVRRVITWHIPSAFILTVWAYSLVSGGAPAHVQVLTGGVLAGACFMATDYVTSPITSRGKLVFGVGCGLLTMLIRQFGSYPEGCSFSILIMNSITPLINRWTQPKPFGAKR